MGAEIGPPTKRAMIRTGTYVGNGVDDRNIDIGINLAAKSNVWVIVNGATGGTTANHRIEYGQGDLGMYFEASNDIPDMIQAFTSTGFQIGATGHVNADGITYRYIVFWEEP